MSENDTSGQETDALTDDELAARRAEWEGFEFRVPTAGRVRVENVSWGDESGEHVHIVEVAEHVGATACTCKSDEYRSTACKHRRAIEHADPVMLAATDGLSGAFPERDALASASASSVETHPIAADGGQVADTGANTDAETCDRCPKPLAECHDEPAGHTVVTTDGEELCPECADARSGEEIGFGTSSTDTTDDSDGDTSRERPTRSEPADFGGGEASGMDQL